MDKDLFDTTDIDVQEFLNDQEDTQDDVILDTVVGDGKKYKTVNDLARAAIHKDMHIKKIEDENRKLRELAAKAKGADEILKALQAKNQPNTSETDRDNDFANSGVSGGENNGNRSLTEEDITQKVLAAMEAKTTQKKQDENFSYVKKELLKNLGAEYPNVIRQKAEELGLSDEDLTNLAKKTPKAFFNLLGMNPADPVNVSPNPVSRASEATAFNRAGEKTFSHYEKIRKTNPNLYYSKQVQNELLEQAFKLGNAFYR